MLTDLAKFPAPWFRRQATRRPRRLGGAGRRAVFRGAVLWQLRRAAAPAAPVQPDLFFRDCE